MFYELGSLSGEAMNLAKLAHWDEVACPLGEASLPV